MDTEKFIDRTFRIQNGDVVPYVGKTKPTRKDLADLFGKIGFKLGAEIGVRRGEFSHRILRAMGDGKMILVDPWERFRSPTQEAFSQEKADQYYARTMERLSDFKDQIIVKRMYSQDAVKEIEDNSLDFVYIDALHDFDHAVVDIIEWSKKVRPGGIVSGHDYHTGYNFGVIEAVNAYTRCHNIDKWYLTREGVPSFFWVKK